MNEISESGAVVRAVTLGVPTGAELGLLAPAEHHRAKRFVSRAAAHEFLSGRVALRLFAAELAQVAPTALEPDYLCRSCRAGAPDHGMPRYRLRDGSEGPLLSLSRAAGWAVLAGARPQEGVLRLGVDVELVGRAEFPGFDDLVLTPREQHLVSSSPDASVLRTRIWARKEAFLKATGAGLRRDPATVEVTTAEFEGMLLTEPDPAALGVQEEVVVALATSRS